MPTPPIPINAEEAIVEPFWHPPISSLAQWRQEADAETSGSAGTFWFGAMIQWKRGDGHVVTRMTRDVDWIIEGYDRLSLCLTLPSTARLHVRATIDGQPRSLLEAAPGRDNFEEYEAPIAGRRIERLEIELRDTGPGPGQGRLMWVGVFHQARRDAARSAPSPYEEAIERLMLPAADLRDAAPTLGLHFGPEELAGLRQKAKSPAYAPLFARLRERAKQSLTREPWRGVGRFPNEGGPRGSRGGTAGHIDPLAMRLGALVGLIDEDPDLLRMAARHALSLAHCEYWFPDFLEAFPGSGFEQRAFFDYRWGTALVYAWDWAGCCVSPAGRELFAHAIASKAVGRIQETLMRHPYVRGCNQGAYMSYGAIVCLAALSKVWRHARDYIEPAKKALDETMETYLAPDGGAFEGVGYVSSTIGHALVAYQLLARMDGKSLAEVVPAKVLRSADYLAVMLSTAPPAGAGINVADGGRPGSTLYPECLPYLARLAAGMGAPNGSTNAAPGTGIAAMPALLAAMLDRPLSQENFGTPGSAFVFLFGPEPDDLPAPAARPPVFCVLPQTGQLCSCRETPASGGGAGGVGLVRLQLIGAPADAGHGHEDRGSFVLEAFGEEIAIDRGQMEYSDPRCGVIKAARYHNLLIPLDDAGQPTAQMNPCRSATLPTGTGDAQRLRATIEAGPAWGPGVARWTRTITSHEPTTFDVLDEMDFAPTGAAAHGSAATSPRAVGFHLHSRFPWLRDEASGAWVTHGQRAELRVDPQWTPARVFAGEDFIDGNKKPTFTLALIAPPAASHRLLTRLSVSPVAQT
ncbi:MAG: heparinase II/III family protein [Planctomycetota bacterium]|nr:heparinase II/III family protein [Planctomycetota bacterium]